MSRQLAQGHAINSGVGIWIQVRDSFFVFYLCVANNLTMETQQWKQKEVEG